MSRRPCAVCGAQVTVRRSKGGKAYTMCNAELVAESCGSRVVYGARHSRHLLEGLEPAPAPAPAPAPKSPARAARTPAKAGRPRAPARPAAPTERQAPAAPGGKSGWGLGDW